MIVGLIITILITAQNVNGNIPEINAALSTFVLNNQIAKNIGPIIQEKIKQYNITQNFTQSITEYGLKFQATISEIKIQQLDIIWKQTLLVVYNAYDFGIKAKKINITLFAHISGHQSIRKVNTDTQIILQGLDVIFNMSFINSKSNEGVGFVINIDRVQIDENTLQIKLSNDKLDQRIANLVIKLAKSSINPILNKAIQNQVNPMIQSYMGKRSFISQPVGKYIYQFDINATIVPYFINNTYLSIPIDIKITNTVTSKVNPQEQNQNLPPKVFPTIHDIQAIVSSGFINSVVWMVEDSQIIDLYLNNTGLGADPPINLNTTDLTILMPQLPLKTGKDKGVYLHITSSTKVPQVYIRGGRILASLSVNIDFIVDSTNDYPNNNVSQCLRYQNCILATTLNASIVASVAIKTDAKNKLFGNLQVIKIEKINTYEDSYINVNCDNLKTILNSLVGSFLPPVNFMLRQGIDLPLAMIGGYNITNIQVKTQLDHLAASVIFDFS